LTFSLHNGNPSPRAASAPERRARSGAEDMMSEHDVAKDTVNQSTEAARVALVEDLFHGTGDTYDEVVHVATWGRDRRWKEDLLARIEAPRNVLDLACGTGILALEIARRHEQTRVTGVELRPEYLDICRTRAAAMGATSRTRWACCNAEEFSSDEQFDHITSCYLPKYVDLDVLTPRMVSMLAPGGLFVMQDFAYPREKWVQDIFDDHFARMAERWKHDENWHTMWQKLPRVLKKTRWIDDLVRTMEAAGLRDVTVLEQSRGLSALVHGRKPA
jgi:demethylmenaquinone methyltransferase/2-methoxy-6-polyprenyl-1,4-benzoquinol methylase